jgi:glycosyltransferase involved in cell wall biosynthesis
MHIAVISEFELGSHKAHAINVVKTAGGFVRLGHKVTLLCRPSRSKAIPPDDLLSQYAEPGLNYELQPFRWSYDEAGSAATGWWAARRAADLGADAVYARHFEGALESVARGIPTVMETHAHIGSEKPILGRAFAATNGKTCPLSVVTISHRLRDDYIRRGADPARVSVVADGVDLGLFQPPAELPPSPFKKPGAHAVYCGNLYDYNGIPTILKAASLLKPKGAKRPGPPIHFDLIGGADEDLSRVRASVRRRALRNVTLHGLLPHRNVPPCLWHADVLLLPLSATCPAANWASPVKLGEYLASGPPIIASALPGMMDWVGEPAVRWIEPDNARALRDAIAAALSESPALSRARRAAASKLARDFSYPNRARRILDSLGASARALPTSTIPKAA